MEKRFIDYLIIILLSYPFVVNNISAQKGIQSSRKKNNIEKFILSPFFEASDKDSIRLITFIEIPFKCLSFLKIEENYLASYQASISIKEKNGNEFGHMVWSDSIILSNYQETNSNIRNRKHFSSMKVPINSTYEIIAELQDNDTRKKGIIKKKIDLRNYSKIPKLTKPNFFLELTGDWGFKYGKIPTKGYKVREIGKGIDLQISGFVDSSEYTLEVYLNNNEFVDSLIWGIQRKGVSGFFNETIFISSENISALKNDFKIVLEQNNRNDEQNIIFSKYKSGVSINVPNIDLAFKQMKYILNSNERNLIKKGEKKNREALFLTLWKDRDPTPNTDFNELMDEYYRRVKYADENFDGWQKGWESDRGMIYILFGPPDEIQRSNMSISSNASLQIWTYLKANKQFIFRDENGFGDYRLDNPFLNIGF